MPIWTSDATPSTKCKVSVLCCSRMIWLAASSPRCNSSCSSFFLTCAAATAAWALSRTGCRGRNFPLEKSHHAPVITAVQLVEPYVLNILQFAQLTSPVSGGQLARHVRGRIGFLSVYCQPFIPWFEIARIANRIAKFAKRPDEACNCFLTRFHGPIIKRRRRRPPLAANFPRACGPRDAIVFNIFRTCDFVGG